MDPWQAAATCRLTAAVVKSDLLTNPSAVRFANQSLFRRILVVIVVSVILTAGGGATSVEAPDMSRVHACTIICGSAISDASFRCIDHCTVESGPWMPSR